MSTFRKLASVMLPALFTAAACSDTGAGPDVQLLAQITSVEVVAPPVLEVGTHGQVRVVLRDRKGQPILGPLVTYSSEDTSVVQVDGSGRLTATSPGITEVSAKAGSKQGKSTVRVTGKPGSTTTQVRVSPATGTAQSGQQLQFTAEIVDGSGTVLLDRSVFWWSADTRIATVDEAGLVTGVDAGTALINATSDGVTGSAELTVEAAPPTAAAAPGRVTDLTGVGSTASEIAVRFTEVSDGTGQPANYQVRFGPAPSTNWGTMTPVAIGTCAGVVAGTLVGQSLTCTVAGLLAGASYDIQLVAYRGSMGDGTAVFGEISNSARYATQASAGTASVTISPRDATLRSIGETHQFTVTVRDGSGNVVTDPGVTWVSSNTGVATVNGTGLVTARGAGIALITAAAACCGTDSATVRVELPSSTPGNLVFRSAWDTGVGNSDHFISDGGAWPDYNYCWQTRNNVLNVVAGSTVAWSRTANVLRIQQRGNADCGNIQLNPSPIPASTTHWGRFYFRNDEMSNMHMHPVTYNASGAIQMVPWMRIGTSQGVIIGVGTGGSYPLNMFFAGTPKSGETRDHLPHRTWYRYEWMVEYVTLSSTRIWPRIYNMAGQLLYDANSFYQNDHPRSGSLSLAQHYANGYALPIGDVQLARRFGLGNEGPGMSTASMEYWYIADVGLSLQGWIGQ
jgi:uncharacterized protein YjdB